MNSAIEVEYSQLAIATLEGRSLSMAATKFVCRKGAQSEAEQAVGTCAKAKCYPAQHSAHNSD